MATVQLFDFTEESGDEDKPDFPFEIKYQKRTKVEVPLPANAAKTVKTAKPKTITKWVVESASFAARGEVPAGLVMETLASFNSEDAGVASESVLTFMDRALTPECRERFSTLLSDDNVRIKLSDIARIVQWLMEIYQEDIVEDAERVARRQVGRRRPTRRA